jgi:mRNA-degrading endonuclease toxin of MazEF toxin-antitoxin module
MNEKISFNVWNKKKQKLHQEKKEVIFFEREIWIASLGKNIGIEMNGKKENFFRPILIYKKYNLNQCLIFPLTTKGKNSIFYHKLLNVNFLEKESFICLSQARVIDKKRFFRKLGKISVGQFLNIKKSAQAMLEPQSPRWL